jgi:hypothetical protein
LGGFDAAFRILSRGIDYPRVQDPQASFSYWPFRFEVGFSSLGSDEGSQMVGCLIRTNFSSSFLPLEMKKK